VKIFCEGKKGKANGGGGGGGGVKKGPPPPPKKRYYTHYYKIISNYIFDWPLEMGRCRGMRDVKRPLRQK